MLSKRLLNEGYRVVMTDIVEPVQKFTDAISSGSDFAALRAAGRIGQIHNVGLEAWDPEPGAYDLIWHQWCLGQLTDEELVAYLKRAKKGLAEGGYIVAKENVAGGDVDDFDEQDSAVTRALGRWRRLFERAGCKIEMEEMQRGFPRGLFVVKTWALRPA